MHLCASVGFVSIFTRIHIWLKFHSKIFIIIIIIIIIIFILAKVLELLIYYCRFYHSNYEFCQQLFLNTEMFR